MLKQNRTEQGRNARPSPIFEQKQEDKMKQFFKVVMKFHGEHEEATEFYFIAENMGAVYYYFSQRGQAYYLWEIKRLMKIPAGRDAFDIRAI